MDFISELEKTGIKIKTVNIGGGLSSSYTHATDPTEFTFQKYREVLEASVPQLFSGKYEVRLQIKSIEFVKCILAHYAKADLNKKSGAMDKTLISFNIDA